MVAATWAQALKASGAGADWPTRIASGLNMRKAAPIFALGNSQLLAQSTA